MSQRREPRDSLDPFFTPPWATRALLEEVIGPRLSFPAGEPGAHAMLRTQNVWEPACGPGHMASVLAEYFYAVHASDVADYRATEVRAPQYLGQRRVADFLCPDAVPAHIEKMGVDWIITNPPFRSAPEFILRAVSLRPRKGVAMLTRLAFLEGIDRYRTIYSPAPPSIIAQFAERVPMVKGRLTAKGTTATAYCWLVWLTGEWSSAPVFQWIPPCRKRLEREGDYAEEQA